MMTTLSNGTTTVTPELVAGYQSKQEPRTIAHPILGAARDDVTLRPASLRTGVLRLLFLTEAAAEQARALHSAASVWTLSDPDRTTLDMIYVVTAGAGELTVDLDDQTRARWLVTVPFREVVP